MGGGRRLERRLQFTFLLLACNMMMLAMLSLVPIETHLEADFVVCLPSDLCGIPTHVKVFRILTRFDQKSGLVVILQFGGLTHHV